MPANPDEFSGLASSRKYADKSIFSARAMLD
jgi:hypothetical protein